MPRQHDNTKQHRSFSGRHLSAFVTMLVLIAGAARASELLRHCRALPRQGSQLVNFSGHTTTRRQIVGLPHRIGGLSEFHRRERDNLRIVACGINGQSRIFHHRVAG